MADDDLARHLTTIRSQIENVTIDIGRREELPLDMAATLDRAAQLSPNPYVRHRRWSEALSCLIGFLKDNPDPPRERQVRFQAALLRWAQGRSWTETALLGRDDHKPRQMAVAAFDNAIDRFRSIAGAGNNPTLADNLRFRLAEALADRADLEPAGAAARRSRESEALDLLDQVPAGNGPRWFLALAQGGPVPPAGKTLPRPRRRSPRPSSRSPPRRRAKSSRSISHC